MPNVPKVPGVPPLTSYAANSVSLLVGNAIINALNLGKPAWGLYKDGIPVVVAENVVSIDYKRDWNLPDYPIENGGFKSYDKVQLPFSVRLRFSAGGDIVDRQNLLNSIAAISETLDLFDAVTPEVIYENVNVMHYDYRRAANNVGLIVVDVWCQEVRLNSLTVFSSTKSASSAGVTNNGTVQPTSAPASATAQLPSVT
jgi:hypothetical protein